VATAAHRYQRTARPGIDLKSAVEIAPAGADRDYPTDYRSEAVPNAIAKAVLARRSRIARRGCGDRVRRISCPRRHGDCVAAKIVEGRGNGGFHLHADVVQTKVGYEARIVAAAKINPDRLTGVRQEVKCSLMIIGIASARVMVRIRPITDRRQNCPASVTN